MTTHLILGTAGHIDHGKTTLIKALTGVDTDRLPEEKKRGITIELGFAELPLGDFHLGIVDVPGHERFVRNMLAGATGVDVALLVVAADDSVKPQTREHLDILRLLHIHAGVIALTKCDVADADWIDLVEEEIRDLVQGTFLENAPIIRVSAHQGNGIEALKEALEKVAEKVAAFDPRGDRDGPFRMAIDRTFTIAGHGTVVTGSVAAGTVNIGDELLIEPDHLKVRIRGLQQHDRTVESVLRGQRAAINLGGIHHEEIRRGHELATAGYLIESKLLTIKVHVLASAKRPLKNRARIRFHVGTAEVMASVHLLQDSELAPGDEAIIQCFLSDPVVTTWNQPVVLRNESPVETIGGGAVLDASATKIRLGDKKRIEQVKLLESLDPMIRAGAAIYLIGLQDWSSEDLARMAGISRTAEVVAELQQQGIIESIAISPTKSSLVHQQVIKDIAIKIESSLKTLHDQFPLNAMIDRSRLHNRLKYLESEMVIEAVLEQLAKKKRIKISPRGIALAGAGAQLTNGEQQLVEQIIKELRESGFQPPTVKEFQNKTTKNQAVVPQLFSLAAAEGHLVEFAKGMYLHADLEAQMRADLTEAMHNEGMTMSQLRERMNTSRKYAVPICEYWDRAGFTRREGDLRVLASP